MLQILHFLLYLTFTTQDDKKKSKKASPPKKSSKAAKKSSSSDDSDDSSDSEDEKPVKNDSKKDSKKEAKKPAPAPAKKDESSDSSDSSSSDDEPAQKSAPAESSKKDDSSSSDSSDSSDEDEKMADAKAPPKKAAKDDSSDSSDSDSSDDDKDAKVTEKPAPAKKDDSSSSSDSSSDEEEKAEPAPAPEATEAPSKKRKAEDMEVPETITVDNTPQIFVGQLSWNIDDEWLKSEFEQLGTVKSARVQLDRQNGRSRGFGYVEFESHDIALKAMEQFAGKEIDGRPIRVDLSVPRAPNPEKRAKSFGDQRSDPSNTLFVGNLSFNTNEDSVWEFFGEFGAIESVRVPTDRETGAPKGFGYVSFADVDTAKAAIDGAAGSELDGRVLRLDFSTPKDRSARPPRGGGARGGGRGGRGGRGGAPRGGGRGGFNANRSGAIAQPQGKKMTFD